MDESKFVQMQHLLFCTLDWQKGRLVREESADLSHRFQPEMPSLETAMPMLRELSAATPSYHITNLQYSHKAQRHLTALDFTAMPNRYMLDCILYHRACV